MDLNLVRVTGFIGLSISILGLAAPRDKKMLRLLSASSFVWAINNFLLGAMTSAALSCLSAVRSATCSHLTDQLTRLRPPLCAAFCATTVGACAVTWCGPVSLLTMTGSLISTVSNFYLSGVGLRIGLAFSPALWLASAIHYRAREQIFSLSISLLASSYGIWQAHQAAASHTRELQVLSPPL